MTQQKPIIGLAGGIGSGKSSVAKQMESMGARVIDADALAAEALQRDDVRDRLIEWWGPGILDEGRRVDRKRVAERVFSDPEQRRRLEGVIHPIVAEQRDQRIAEARNDPDVRAIVLDVPLLFEVGLDRRCDRIVFVDCDRATRLQRLQEHRGWDEAELARRERSQMPIERKIQLADDIVDNSNGEAECFAQVRALMTRLLDPTD